jgi:dipeptidyl-peptidase-4
LLCGTAWRADDEGSVVKRAANFDGRHMIFCHGTGDDNVHFQQTVMLINALIELENNDFDLMIYPNRQHGIAANGAKRHIYHELWQWLAAEFQLPPTL